MDSVPSINMRSFDKNLLDTMPLACVLFNESAYSVIHCNTEAVRLFGCSDRDELIAHQAELLPESQPDGTNSRRKLQSGIYKAIETGRAVFNFVCKDFFGAELPTELTMAHIRLQDEYVVSAYIRDCRAARDEYNLSLHSRLLQAVNKMATRLIESGPDDFEEAIRFSLKAIGQAVNADRSYIWENFVQDGKLYCRQLYEWSYGAEPQQGKEFTISLDYNDVPYWREQILNNRTINGPVSGLPGSERNILELQGIKSLLMIPLSYRGRPWGFIGFDDCHLERTFAAVKEQMLRSGGILIISSIVRNDMTRRLVNTRKQLLSQERLLLAVNDVAELLLGTENAEFLTTVRQALMTLGLCINSSQASIWRNSTDEQGRLIALQFAGWIMGRPFELDCEDTSVDYEEYLPQWLEGQRDLNISLSEADDLLRNLFQLDENKSLMLLPLTVHGNFWGFIAFVHTQDWHSYSEAERNILLSGGMLIASAVIRNEMTENIVEARENALASARAKSEFLSRMSHEIRTPMNAIISMTSLARKSGDIHRIQHYLETVDASSQHLMNVINDVLDMSKIDADKLEIINKEFDFEEMIQHVFDVIKVKLSEKRIDFRLDYPHVFLRNTISDELRLSQVLINLLSNAIKFTPEYGTITLKVSEEPIDATHSALRLEVIDNGIGIAPEQLTNIFQSFEQGDGSVTRKYGGTGLGLAISERIMKLMGGSIRAESEPGRGSSFIVELNVGWCEKHTDAHEAKALRKNLRILVVDDAPDVLEYFMTVLDSFSLKCETASTGKDAINLVRESKLTGQPYNIIFLDWYMPGLSGLETAREIKHIMNDDILVIMISTADWEEIERDATMSGIQYFLSKPVLSSNLYNMLIQLTSENAPVAEAEGVDWSGVHILLADDIDINREIVSALLEDTGVGIDFAENGSIAIDMYKAAPDKYKLILMDVQMPVLDGLNATKEIRASGIPGCESIPIIAMTAHAFKEDEDASLTAGMNGHISKPIDPDALIGILRDLIN